MLTAILIICICNSLVGAFICFALCYFFICRNKDSRYYPKELKKEASDDDKEREKRKAQQKAKEWQNFFSYNGESQIKRGD